MGIGHGWGTFGAGGDAPAAAGWCQSFRWTATAVG